MMTPTDHGTPVRPNRQDWPTLLIVAVCAAAVGVLGTLLWTKGQPPPAAPAVAAAATGAHEPPPELTAGMDAAQSEVVRGNWHYDHKEWPQAITYYQKAIAAGMDVPDIRTDLGSAYRFNGETDKALEQYGIAQKQDPTHEASLFNEASVYAFTLHQPDKAVPIWKEYLKRFPNGANAKQVREFLQSGPTSGG